MKEDTCVCMGFPGGSVGKESAYKAGDAGDMGSVPGLGRFPGVEHCTHSRVLAWKVPWMEEPGRLQSMGSQRMRHDLVTKQQQLLTRLISRHLPSDYMILKVISVQACS